MSAILYELTASAARVCTPLPIATVSTAPHRWLGLLDHWQTLVGNWVGGLLGVAGALIVAVMVRRRDRRIAAAMVRPDIQRLAEAGRLIKWLIAKANHVPPEHHATHAMNQLRERRMPNTAALQTMIIGQLSDIDARLSSHLFQCEMAHQAFEEGLAAQYAWSDNAMAMPFEPGASRPPRFRGIMPSDNQLYRDWQLSTEHAELASYFLDAFVFSSWPRWLHRLRMKWWLNDIDRRSAHLLTTGEILETPAPTVTADACSPSPASEPV